MPSVWSFLPLAVNRKGRTSRQNSSVPRSSSSSFNACDMAGDEILSFSDAFLTDLPSATAKKFESLSDQVQV